MVVKGYNKYYGVRTQLLYSILLLVSVNYFLLHICSFFQGIPRCFTEEASLGKVSMVMIIGPRGEMWSMKTTFSSNQVILSVGWSKFLHENEIVIGDTLLFKHVPNTGNLIHVLVVNKDGTGNCGSLAGKRPKVRLRKQIELPPSTKYFKFQEYQRSF